MNIIGAATSGSLWQQATMQQNMNALQQNFAAIGAALNNGDIAAAKKAMEQIEVRVKNNNGAVSENISRLGRALESGDLTAAKAAHADIKAKRPKPPAKGGKPPAGANAAGGEIGSSSKSYDVRDSDKDGKVSFQELLDYLNKQLVIEKKVAGGKDRRNDGATSKGAGEGGQGENSAGSSFIDLYF